MILKKYTLISGVVLFSLLSMKAFADRDYGYYSENRYRGNHSYQGGFASREGGDSYRGYSSEVYYSCPNGDYISDRPGQCPLDGSPLVARRSTSGARNPYENPYAY
ncbi:MAG: hypothetical protein HYS07_04265 [Chlamydiae bacterium]|nr:hypothetical protein [Chlamydiota bacterium]MBI3277413.1 hypothetical protein [Chlamydiota bacterium]